MKLHHKILWILFIFFLPAVVSAQEKEPQTGDTTHYRTLIPESKQGLLRNVDMIANMQFGLENAFSNQATGNFDYTGSRFRFEQFRLEFKGQVFKSVYFRFRNRYTKTPDVQSVDHLYGSVDLAYIRVTLSKKWNISLGKMCADWGGIEFDMNPIDIYEYSDIIEMADNFLTGVGVSYQFHKNHSFTFQALNSRTKTFNELYGNQPNITESKFPLMLVGNWRGSFFHGKFNTIWSYAIFSEAKNIFMNYIALGNQLHLGKFTIEYDFKWSSEDLDRTGIVSATVPDVLIRGTDTLNFPYAVKNTLYYSHWLHLYYRINKHLNVALIGMVDFAKWQSDVDPLKTTNDIRVAWGYIPTIEYYPFKDLNLRFYATWVGRIYNYSGYAKDQLGAKDYATGRFQIGFISPLGIL
jgi:Phosphate-selective porin O and P